jgi:hypothetical protein
MFNINKGYSEATATDAQAALAKKGKYKLKTGTSTFKQPRMIETEGREPIFSPEKADGTRDLLYYNPNDPTHEEGGVKAMVMPKAQEGKQAAKSQPVEPEYLEDTDSWTENVAELFDPSGITSWDDAYRALKNVYNNPKEKGLYTQALFETLGAVPVMGKMRTLIKAGKAVDTATKVAKSIENTNKATKWADRAGDVWSVTTSLLPDLIGDPFNNEGFNYQKGTFNGRNIFPQFRQTYRNVTKAYGAKQLKVNNLNTTALSQNFAGMPAANAANKFVQPLASIQQVARNIPEDRRKEKINTPRSHKKVNPDTNRIIDPPMLYEMKPPPPRSTFNTKNDFQDGVNKLEGDLISKVIMNRNRDKDFVQRAYAIGQYPNSNMFTRFDPDKFGDKNTHLMVWGEDNRGQAYMEPDIMNPKKEKIKVPNQYADYISDEGYKKATGMKKGGKYIRTYQTGTDGTEANATYKHSKTFKDRIAYQEALKTHDDSLKLHKQSRYFTDKVLRSNLYQPTVENPPVKEVVRTGKSTTSSPTKKFGAPDDRAEEFITVKGINPVRKDLYSRKESKYKSFKEYEEAKAADEKAIEHEGYEINMYKHPEMAVNYAPDTVSPIKVRTPKLKIPKDSLITQTPKQVIIPNTKTPTKDKEEVVSNKPRGKYIAKEKTTLEKIGDKASQFFNKIGSSNRPVNGRRITVFK